MYAASSWYKFFCCKLLMGPQLEWNPSSLRVQRDNVIESLFCMSLEHDAVCKGCCTLTIGYLVPFYDCNHLCDYSHMIMVKDWWSLMCRLQYTPLEFTFLCSETFNHMSDCSATCKGNLNSISLSFTTHNHALVFIYLG